MTYNDDLEAAFERLEERYRVPERTPMVLRHDPETDTYTDADGNVVDLDEADGDPLVIIEERVVEIYSIENEA